MEKGRREITTMQDGKIEVCMEVKEQISTVESSKIVLKKRSVLLEEFIISVGEKEQKFSGVLFNEEKRRKECFDRQEVFGIYIRNGIKWQEFIGRSVMYKILPTFIYEIPNQSGEFCAVYVAEHMITDLKIAGLYNEMLMKIFPEADSESKVIGRVFTGGRKIVYFGKYNRLIMENLVCAFHVAMKRVDSHNFKRNVENVAKKYGIACEKGFLKIYDGNLVENIPGNVMMIGNMVIEYRKSKRKFLPISQEGKKNERELKAKITTISGIDANKMRMYCHLYKDFVEKGVPDIHKRLLLTNLCHIKRGKTIFFKGIEEDNELVWNCIWTQSKVYNYIPIECNAGGCPYKNICNTKSLYSKLLGQVISLKTEETYVSIREAENEFKQYLDEAIDEKKNMLYLIKAQTALGKTQAYCNLAANKTDQVYMIAVPTLKLQEEVARELQNKGVNCIKTVSCIEIAREMNLPICKELDLLYKCGYDDKVKGTLQKYKSEHEDELSDVQNLRLEKCLNQLDTLDGSCCVVTTHNMILNLPVHILKKYEIIIDEDLLMSIFRDGGSVCENKLREAFRLSIFKDDAQERLRLLLSSPQDEVIKLGQDINCMLPREYMEEYGEIIKLLKSRIFYYDSKKKEIQYFNPREIPNVKMTVLSATLNEKLWKDFCRNRRIKMKEVREAKYIGKLFQYTCYSMSRKCIQENGYENIKSHIMEITGKRIISINTFKSLNEEVAIHFGKTEGFDGYKGEDLVVLGTPHYIESLYKMIGAYLNYDTSKKMFRQRVENSSYSFILMTFKDIEMRNLQMFFLESELEQAVGRARLLRYGCNVWVFSNFPLKQAQIIQDDYLKS